MYAIINIAGQQMKVEKDQHLYVNRVAGKEGDKLRFEEVLLVENDGKIDVGIPAVSGAAVTATVVEHLKGDKVIVFKKKRRKGYQKRNGHRQLLTKISITGIEIGGKKQEDKAETKEKATAEKPAPVKREDTPKTEAKPATEAKAKTEEKPKVEAKPATESKAKVEEKPKAEAKPATESKAKVEEKPKAETKPAAAEKPKVEAKPEKKAADDLAMVEGIGPKISELLQKDGITSFAELAKTKVDRLKEILEAAGPAYASHAPDTWPEQAKLAAEGKFDELKELQDKLDGGVDRS